MRHIQTMIAKRGCSPQAVRWTRPSHTAIVCHYETWTHWRRDRTVDPALRALMRAYEYEAWPRGRIVFERPRDLYILYADRKLLTPATIARIETQFLLPTERTEIHSDWHYQSTETPNGLGS